MKRYTEKDIVVGKVVKFSYCAYIITQISNFNICTLISLYNNQKIRTRKLKATWSFEASKDFHNFHNKTSSAFFSSTEPIPIFIHAKKITYTLEDLLRHINEDEEILLI